MNISSIRYANGYTPSFHQKAAPTTAMSSTKYSITNTTKRSPSKSQPLHTAPIIPSYIKQVLVLDSLNDTFGTKRLSLQEGIPVKIGRSTNRQTSPAEANGYFDSKVLSRTHAEVWFENGKVYVKDMGSSNGTFVNGRRINFIENKDEKVELRQRDILEFGIDIYNDQDKKLLFRKVCASVSFLKQYNKNLSTKYKSNNDSARDEDTDDITKFDFNLNTGFSIYDFLEKELLNCKEEYQRLNEMSTTLNDITNIFDNADKVLITKTTNGFSKRESCSEKDKLEKLMDNVIHKENREKKIEPFTTNINGSFKISNDSFFEDLNYNNHDNKKTIKPQYDEISRLNEEIKRFNEKFENQAHGIVLKDCEIKSLQANNRRLINEISRIRQDLEKSNANCNKYRELIEKEQAKHKTETEKLICSLQNELKDSQKTNSIVKSLQTQLEDFRAINELLKRNYESIIEENKLLRENIRRAELEKGTQLEFVKKLGHEIAMNSGLENDLSKSSLPQVNRNGHSKQISEPIKDSEWTGDNDEIITDEINDNKGGTIEKSKIGYSSNIVNKHGFKLVKTSMLQGIDAPMDNAVMSIKQETINGDLTKNKLTKKCSRTIVMSSKGRGVKTTKNECMTESSDSNQVVKKVKSEIKSGKGTQSIKNVSLTWTVGSLLTLLFLHSMIIIFIQTAFFQSRFPLPWLNSPTYNNSSLFEMPILNSSLSNLLNWILSWFNLSPNWGSSTWNLPMTDIISWDASRINAEALKIGATTLEVSMGWVVLEIEILECPFEDIHDACNGEHLWKNDFSWRVL
ncbi:2577_t:CDS:10 [Dentiscutata erythropus]|uniref:2577_t:CDS:1 n=1 Tax=Dentiscutata erythropus TaxID=1348616 RepID=A0A9N8VBA2_9GLOM|nr:2577_t:CDS:10 [Dentiscutata erythropus]